jgi:hypothetical protein
MVIHYGILHMEYSTGDMTLIQGAISGSPQTQVGPGGHRFPDQNPERGNPTRRVGGVPPHKAGAAIENGKGKKRSKLGGALAAIRPISSKRGLDIARRRELVRLQITKQVAKPI